MAYTTLPAADIVAGKPTKEEIFDQIRTNQEDFDTRITGLTGTNAIDVFNVKFGGSISQYSVTSIASRIPVFRAPVGAKLIQFNVTLLGNSSTGGTLTVDLKRSTDNGVTFTSIMLNPVTVTGLIAGSKNTTVDWLSVPDQSFNQDDLLQVEITGLQTNQAPFHVAISGELG
jgi:hypothetical protein